MTSDSLPTPYVVSTNRTPERANQEVYRAFDGDTDTFFQNDISFKTTFPQILTIDLGAGNGGIAKSFDITQFGDNYSYNAYSFEGSTDNSTWVVLKTGNFSDDADLHTISFTNTVSYRYYRLSCSSSYRLDDCAGIKEFVIDGDRSGGAFIFNVI